MPVSLPVRESSKRIIGLCEDKPKLKGERETAREQRKKIVGASERITNSDDRYLDAYSTPGKESFKIPDDRNKGYSGIQDYNNMGSYDSYKPQSSLSEKIGNIMQGVDLAQAKIEKQDRLFN